MWHMRNVPWKEAAKFYASVCSAAEGFVRSRPPLWGLDLMIFFAVFFNVLVTDWVVDFVAMVIVSTVRKTYFSCNWENMIMRKINFKGVLEIKRQSVVLFERESGLESVEKCRCWSTLNWSWDWHFDRVYGSRQVALCYHWRLISHLVNDYTETSLGINYFF